MIEEVEEVTSRRTPATPKDHQPTPQPMTLPKQSHKSPPKQTQKPSPKQAQKSQGEKVINPKKRVQKMEDKAMTPDAKDTPK